MIRYAVTMLGFSGAHQKSSGSTTLLPSTRKASTSPKFEGLNACAPRCRIRYLESSDTAATRANTYQPCQDQWSPRSIPTSRRIRATPLPVSMALAGHTSCRLVRRTQATSITAQVRMAARIWGTETRNPRATWPRTWMETITKAKWSRGSRALGRTTG
jgi:hypothetical protein